MHRFVAAVHDRFHEARADLFVAVMKPWDGARLLDLGGGQGTFADRICKRVRMQVTVADVDAGNRWATESRGFHHVTLDGSGELPFKSGEFDFVLSNSVIEHVTMPKERCRIDARVSSSVWRSESARAQRLFADEIRRVGGSYFVQTPHKHFPIDPHVYLPLVQYLTHDASCRVVRFTDRWWLHSCDGNVDWHLLTTGDMVRLFPDAEVRVERFLGLPKSIVAFRRQERISYRVSPPRSTVAAAG